MGRPIGGLEDAPVRVHPDPAVDEDREVGPEAAECQCRGRPPATGSARRGPASRTASPRSAGDPGSVRASRWPPGAAPSRESRRSPARGRSAGESTAGNRRAARPERSPTSAWRPSGSVRVLPPRKSIGPSRASAWPTRRSARSSASMPPCRWARSASRVTGMYLSPAVVPDVLQYSAGRPGQRTFRSPPIARSMRSRTSR